MCIVTSQIEICKELENKTTLVIGQDGWSSVQNDPTIAHSRFHTRFLQIADSGAEKTADYCFTFLSEAIVEIKHSMERCFCYLHR